MADGDKIDNGAINSLEHDAKEQVEKNDDSLIDGDKLRNEKQEKIAQESEEIIVAAAEADKLKEHDVIEEEAEEADRIKGDINKELAENDGWMKILGNDQLMKKIIGEGVPNKRPLRGEIVTLKIKGKLKGNEDIVFEERDQYIFQLGDAEVITGLDLTLPLMCKGEVAVVQVAPRFGYGSKGMSPLVPPNSDLIFEIELIDFESEKELEQLTIAERRDIGSRKRERGNWWYGRDESSLAVQCYRRALEFLDEVEGGIQYPKGDKSDEKMSVTEELKSLLDDRLKTYNNMAAAQLKLQAYEPALTSVDAVLKCQPDNVKALFRKGKILSEKGDTERAIEVLKSANKLEPNNQAIIQEIKQMALRQKKEHQSEKLLYKRMFNDKSNPKETSNSQKRRSMSLVMVVGGAIMALAGVMAYKYRFG